VLRSRYAYAIHGTLALNAAPTHPTHRPGTEKFEWSI